MPFGISFGIGPFRFWSGGRRRRRSRTIAQVRADGISSRYNRALVRLRKATPANMEKRRAEFEKARAQINEFSANHPGLIHKVRPPQF